MSRAALISIAKGAGVAAAGAALTYLTHWMAGADMGPYTPLIVAVLSVLVNAGRKWLVDNGGTTAAGS